MTQTTTGIFNIRFNGSIHICYELIKLNLIISTILISFIALQNACAEEQTNHSIQNNQAIHLEDNNIIDQTHRILSDTTSRIGARIDNLLSGNTDEDYNKNKTKLTVETKQVFQETGGSYLNFRFSTSIDLPKTSKNMKLFIKSDPEVDSLVEEALPSQDQNNESRDGIGIGVSVDSKPGRKWSSSVKLGMRARLPLDLYTKYQIKRSIALNENWDAIPRQEFWYFMEDGAGGASRIEFTRPVNDSIRFYTRTELQFEDINDYFEFSQSINFSQLISRKSHIRYSTGMISRSTDDFSPRLYYITSKYTKNFYREWLDFIIYPEVRFAEANDFDEDLAISFH